jgi:hemerythrin-like domain-containing protein
MYMERTLFEVLAAEHRDLEARFARVQALGPTSLSDARAAFHDLAEVLRAHLRAERAVAYPRFAQLGPVVAAEIVDARIDHANIEEALDALAGATLTPSEWLRAVRRLEALFEHHVDSEEREVFPFARRALSIEEARELARRFVGTEHVLAAAR